MDALGARGGALTLDPLALGALRLDTLGPLRSLALGSLHALRLDTLCPLLLGALGPLRALALGALLLDALGPFRSLFFLVGAVGTLCLRRGGDRKSCDGRDQEGPVHRKFLSISIILPSAACSQDE